ncbi:phage terminase large subunit [Aurantimonas sp. MSK8Z-1]|uniref:phage terminase large subunit n=1 Tax=Mangrovibrevibacter kandeliae TaxID=2968473 RepID=UPI002117AEFD|nr:phage terminase large subunit [Aurantimonas sp. MSK8Z-1]MCW4115663.1 phage terminase large subunit [Aurantimonas sp. MSK8Z-1]
MPNPNTINPLTGRRYGWEAEQRASQEAALELREVDKQLGMLQRQKVADDARTHLSPYIRFTMPDPAAPNDVTRSRYDEQPFHRAISNDLTRFVNGELLLDDGTVCRQLIFVEPPRHGKTEQTTKRLSAWYSGLHPDHDIAVASYSDTMAEDMGADTRAILLSAQHKQVFPTYKLRRGGSSKSNIQTDRGGRLVFVGRGGALTGRGMHLGIGDDLFKDHEEARSQAVRDQAWNWFTKVFMTRRMGPKLVILTFTRWHPDDIIGRLTDLDNPNYNAVEARKWKIIRLPAIAEENDPLGRAEGEALWPARYDLDFLQSQQRLDPLGFAALYQQRPTVADGILFRRETIQRYKPEELPEDLRYYCASDHAVGTKQRNDPSCFGKAGVDRQDNLWLTDLFWKRVPTDQAVEAMLAMAGGKQRPLLWWAERGHISKSIGPFLRKRMLETGTYINLVEVTPVGDKETRAQSIAARTAMGKVYIPHGPMWDRAVDEMLAFPNGTHDDFVDMLALLGLGMQTQFGPREPTKKTIRPTYGTLAWVKEHDSWAEQQRRETAQGGF